MTQFSEIFEQKKDEKRSNQLLNLYVLKNKYIRSLLWRIFTDCFCRIRPPFCFIAFDYHFALFSEAALKLPLLLVDQKDKEPQEVYHTSTIDQGQSHLQTFGFLFQCSHRSVVP